MVSAFEAHVGLSSPRVKDKSVHYGKIILEVAYRQIGGLT